MKPKSFWHKIVSLCLTGIFFLQFSFAFSQNNDSTDIPGAVKDFSVDQGHLGCKSAVTMSKKRFWLITGIHAVGYGASLYGLSSVWYDNYGQTKFHSFNDNAEWGGMDKLGHITTSWQLSNFSYSCFKWTRMRNNRAALVGSSFGFLYQTTLEFFDGFSDKWGFSWGDMGANFAGCTFAYFRNTGHLKNVQYKFSYHPTKYPQYRPGLLGESDAEKILKDYNGQTYWISLNFPEKWFASNHNWLCFSLGYSIDGFTGARENIFDPPLANPPVFNRTGELFFSLDVDFDKMNIKNKFLKSVLKVFNVVKMPFPAFGIDTRGHLLLKPFYF